MDPALRHALGEALGAEVAATAAVHGGDVATAYRADLADGRTVFAKTRDGAPADFFDTEARGLAWLRSAGTVAVPAVLACHDARTDREGGTGGERGSDGARRGERDDDGGLSYLVLEWIDTGPPRSGTDADLGGALAGLHRSGAPCFGREDARSTGSRGLPNTPCPTWSEFYAGCRLLPLARLARDAGALPAPAIAGLESLAAGLDRFGVGDEAPARLHGDLWAGNRLVGADGRSWLVDPAAHGGHREFDLAMMRLFGGLGPACFAAYHEAFPLGDGWEDRVALHQIAPLVVHAVKFGGGYRRSAADAIDRYR